MSEAKAQRQFLPSGKIVDHCSNCGKYGVIASNTTGMELCKVCDSEMKRTMKSFDIAWNVVKGEPAKKALIRCLKKKGGAASLKECCEAAEVSMSECKAMINSMDNVKISPHGDVVLMDGLQKARDTYEGAVERMIEQLAEGMRFYASPIDPKTRKGGGMSREEAIREATKETMLGPKLIQEAIRRAFG